MFYKLLLFLISFIGLFGLTLIILKKYLWANLYECFSKKNIQNETIILFLSICWFITLGLIGVICSLFFYLNLTNYYARILLLIIGLIGILYVFLKRHNLKDFINIQNYKKKFSNILIKEKIIILIILFIYSIFLYKSLIPWFDQDEISQYGYSTLLISNDWKISDDFYNVLLGFGEILYAPFYWVTENTLLPRFIRSTGILFNAFAFYSICRFLSASRFISLLGSAAFLATPELAVIGVSMKVDVVLLGFELMALLLFSLAIFSINFNGLLKIEFPKFINKFFLFSIIFGLLAMSSRNSGLYSLILVTFIGLPIIILNSKNSLTSFKYLFAVITIGSFICIPFIYNIINYFNPFYPLNGPWMFLFPGGEFQPKFDILKNDVLRNSFNIDIGIPILNDLYIIFYHASGIGSESRFDSLNLPSRPDGAASGWLNPILLIVFLSPFYFYKSKEVLLIFISFVILYIFWSNGWQYSRIFIASSSLTILIAIKIITLDHISTIGYVLKNIVKYLVITVIIIFTYYHFRSAAYYNPYGLSLLIDKEIVYSSNARKIFHPNLWDKFSSTSEERLFAKKELSKLINYNEYINLQKIISSFQKPLIIFHTFDEIKYMQILFNKGLYTKIKNNDFEKISDEINKYAFNSDKVICILTNAKLNNNIKEIFVNILYKSQDRIILRCKLK